MIRKTWFTSDTHYSHARIIQLAKRPFQNAFEMDAFMIARHNERVGDNDIVYHLGDFAFGDHLPYLRQLKGEMHLVIGNHDHSKRIRFAKPMWASMQHYLEINVDDTPLVLCHYALRVWNKSHYGAINLFGHSHGNLQGDSQSNDVGVDVWNFQPVSLDEIKKALAMNPRRGEPDHHKRKIHD